jgi:hypothetical protein
VPEVWKVAPEVEVYEVRVVGVRPLLMHRPNLSVGASRRRSEIPSPEEEALSALYTDGDIVVIPSINVKAMIRDAGRNYRIPQRKATYGAYIKAGIDIEPSPYIPLLNPETNKPYRVSERPWEVDVRPVVVQGNRVLRARPRFDNWALEFRIINLDPGLLKADMIKQILVDAGKYYGLGDFRPEFGRFRVEKFTVVG